MQDNEFEKYVKEEFDKMIKDYDRVHDVLWGGLRNGTISKLQQPDTPLHDRNYPIHWQMWVKAQIEERFLCKPCSYVMKELMQETRGCINPKWISQYCCPACDGTGEFDVDGEESEQCLNCDGYGWLIHLEVE